MEGLVVGTAIGIQEGSVYVEEIGQLPGSLFLESKGLRTPWWATSIVDLARFSQLTHVKI
jgi:hypothetical protein